MTHPLDTLREIAKLYPTRSHALDDWQRQFLQDQLARLEKWGDDILLSDKQADALDKALTAMRKAGAGGEQA